MDPEWLAVLTSTGRFRSHQKNAKPLPRKGTATSTLFGTIAHALSQFDAAPHACCALSAVLYVVPLLII